MYVKIEHENSTAGCVQSVILLKCSRKVRIRYQYTEKHSCFKLDSKQLIIFSRFFFLSLSLFHDTNTHLFLEFFSGRGGGGVSLTVKKLSGFVSIPFHCGNRIRSQNLQLATKVFSLSPITASSFQCLIQKVQNKISRSFSLLWFWLVFGVVFFFQIFF